MAHKLLKGVGGGGGGGGGGGAGGGSWVRILSKTITVIEFDL